MHAFKNLYEKKRHVVALNASMYVRWFRIFQTSRYQGIVSATVFRVFEDLKFKISEGSDQNWSCPESALWLSQLRAFWNFKLMALKYNRNCSLHNTLIPWSLKNPESPNVQALDIFFFLRFEKTYQLLKLNGFGLQFKWMPAQMNDCICITQTQDYLHISAQTQEYTALQHQVKIF